MNTNTNKNSLDKPADEQTAVTGDLEQLYELATLISSARDAVSDEMVTRMSSAFSEGFSLLDRLTRNEGLMQLLRVLDRPESQHLLKGLADALGAMTREVSLAPPAKGGLSGLISLACKPGTQEGIRALSILGQHLSESLREMHRHG
jgi:hypothetical protein